MDDTKQFDDFLCISRIDNPIFFSHAISNIK